MLSLLRKVRSSLFGPSYDTPSGSSAGGRSGKYLVYAVGEILLVVIGILIALQINNWNEDQKDRSLERITLEEIVKSLDSDIVEVRNDSIGRLLDVQKIHILLRHLEDQKANHDSLDELSYYPFRGTFPRVDDTEFKLLSSRGIDLITNPVLRRNIVGHYSKSLHTLEHVSDGAIALLEEFRSYYITVVGKKIGEYFVGYTGRTYTKSYALDYDALLVDEEFHNQLRWRIARKEMEADRLGIYIRSAQILRREIQLELDKD